MGHPAPKPPRPPAPEQPFDWFYVRLVCLLVAVIALVFAVLTTESVALLLIVAAFMLSAPTAMNATTARRRPATRELEARLTQLREWVAAQDRPDWERYERLVDEAYAEEEARQHREPPRTAQKSGENSRANSLSKPPRPARRRQHVIYCNCSPENQARGLANVCNQPGPCAAERARHGPGKAEPGFSDHALGPAIDIAQGITAGVGVTAKGLWQVYTDMTRALVPAFRTAASFRTLVTPNAVRERSTYRSAQQAQALLANANAHQAAQALALLGRQAEGYAPGRLRCTKCDGSGLLLPNGQAHCGACGHLGTPMVQCPACEGRGRVLVDIGRAKIKCATCRGRGLVPAEGMATEGERR